MEIGLSTFGDVGPDGDAQSTLRDLLEEARLADEVGLDVFSIGEHHRADFAVTSPATVLAAIAPQTRDIRLSSAVTVLSSADPVRVFEEFTTVDLLSGGRAEIMAGRGSFTESFPLFGYDLGDYDELFAEHLDLLLALRASERVTWSGSGLRAPLNGELIRPRPVQDPLPVWIAVGGNPQSVVRAATLSLPLVLAIIGGVPRRFTQLTDLYRKALVHTGQAADAQPIALNFHGFVADTAAAAADAFRPGWEQGMNRIGRERGWPPLQPGQFEAAIGPDGHLMLGEPAYVTEKLLALHEQFGHQRTILQFATGRPSHAAMMRSIELFGTEVAPRVREEVARREAPATTVA